VGKWVQVSDNKKTLFFSSPWTPPYIWFETVVSLYPHLELELLIGDIGEGLYALMRGNQGVMHDEDQNAEIAPALELLADTAKKARVSNAADYMETTRQFLLSSTYSDMYSLLDYAELLDSYIELA